MLKFFAVFFTCLLLGVVASAYMFSDVRVDQQTIAVNEEHHEQIIDFLHDQENLKRWLSQVVSVDSTTKKGHFHVSMGSDSSKLSDFDLEWKNRGRKKPLWFELNNRGARFRFESEFVNEKTLHFRGVIQGKGVANKMVLIFLRKSLDKQYGSDFARLKEKLEGLHNVPAEIQDTLN